jgi:hypothetical protein
MNIDPKDRVRNDAAKALELAKSCAEAALHSARATHADKALDMPTRHRRKPS